MHDRPSRRKRRTEAEWSALVKRQRESGLSLRKFAEQHGVPVGSLQRWRRRLASSESSDFVEVSPAATPTPNWQAEIVLPNGTTLRLRG
jgi:transposase-like protein